MKRLFRNVSMKKVMLFYNIILLMLAMPCAGKAQTAIPNPVCYGQPIHLFCTLPGCENPGATITWSNSGGTWTSSDRDPVINPGDAGYASDEFFLSVSYSPPPGGFSGGVTSVVIYPQIILTLTPTNATSCFADNGFINLMVSGGTPPFMFLWSNNAMTQNLVNLHRGVYTVTVTDGNGCQATGSATVGPPDLIVGSVSASQTISAGTAPAELTGVAPANGTSPTYQWQSSTDNVTFTAITNATNLNYQPGTLTATTYYRQLQNATGTCDGPLPTNVVTITISAFSCGISTLSDYDGNTYNTVQIGDQCWMKQNLATTHYANGTAIQYITDNSTWGALGDNNTDDAFCWYNNNINNKHIYGALYTWAAAMGDNGVSSNTNPSGVQGVCPDGWHLPSDAEWTQLTTFLGGLNVSGGKMKETGTIHWSPPNTGASNSSGYTGLPAGYRSSSSGSFNSLGNYGYGWSSRSSSTGTGGYAARLNYNDETLYRTSFSKSYGFSVRCLKNSCDIIGLILTPTPVRCFGLSDGAIELSVSGGTPDYTYLWSNNATTQNIADLSAGEYTVTVTDENGYQAIASTIVPEPAELTLTLIPASVTSCGGTDGQVDLYVSGGTGPYTFLWSNNATTPGLVNLTAGTYSVTVTDENSCTASSSITIIEPCEPPIPPTNLQATNITSTSAELGWIKVGCETNWNIRYGLPGFNPDIEGTEISGIIDNPFTLTGLDGCTTYEFYVQSACNSVSVSNWAGPVAFSTTGCLDFGDAPDNMNYYYFEYKTLLTNNGARHLIDEEVYLGNGVTPEPDGKPSMDAGLDENDDGILFNGLNHTFLHLGQNNITVIASVAGFLDAWVDLDSDKNWEGIGKHVLQSYPVNQGENPDIPFIDLGPQYLFQTGYARFRFRTSSNPISYDGFVENGEVEDYMVTVTDGPISFDSLDYGDAPDSYQTIEINDGARHDKLLENIYLGQNITYELFGQPSLNADADEYDDGVDFATTFGIPFLQSGVNQINVTTTVTTTATGYLDLWIDYDNSGDWASENLGSEHVIIGHPLPSGTHPVTIQLPAFNTDLFYFTYARFRFRSSPDPISFSGKISDGEVEDYKLMLCVPDSDPEIIRDTAFCSLDSLYTIPLVYQNDFCNITQTRWFYRYGSGMAWIPYQNSNGESGLNFKLSDLNITGDNFEVKVELELNCHPCPPFTLCDSATVTLCHREPFNMISAYKVVPEGYCGVAAPEQVTATITSQVYPDCDYEYIRWYLNNELAAQGTGAYLPPPLWFTGDEEECYTDHIITVKVKKIPCPEQSKTITIRIFNPNSPLGALEIDPDEDYSQPYCYGEDITLKYQPLCAGDPPTWTWHSTTNDPPTAYSPIGESGTRNPVYNTNRLYETTWFIIEKKNGECPIQTISKKIRIKQPVAINYFTANPDACAKDIQLSLGFTPPLEGEGCSYIINWYKDGNLINSQNHTGSGTYAILNLNNVMNCAGNYYATIHDDCCNQIAKSDILHIEPTCFPVISGPCYRCLKDKSPILLSGSMVKEPNEPCLYNWGCSFQWFLNDLPISGANGLTYSSAVAGTFRLESTCPTPYGTCVRTSLPHTVLQCDSCQTFYKFEYHIESTIVEQGDVFKKHARNTLTVGDPYYFIVKPGGEAELSACQRVFLLEGFTAELGSKCRVYIHDLCCGEKSVEIVNNELSWPEQTVEFSENSLYRIYPNPTTGSFTLEFIDTQGDQDIADTHVEIVNLIGNRLYSADLPFQKQYTISLAGQQPGMYVVRVVRNSKLGIEKIIKQ